MKSVLSVETANKYLQFGLLKRKSILVGSTRTKFEFLNTKLEVDTWKVSYKKDGTIEEAVDGKTINEDIQDILYLGVVISYDGKHTKNILQKLSNAFGTQKQIMQRLKESGKYIIECGFIYINS